jgi:hypothetical protein
MVMADARSVVKADKMVQPSGRVWFANVSPDSWLGNLHDAIEHVRSHRL